mmetsp:Transcript_937/g.2395  ORF Transcript_937/g.2395 Transcript_937/m.2395 type:complete len:102 (+) Transcript_937:1654-1959(+)
MSILGRPSGWKRVIRQTIYFPPKWSMVQAITFGHMLSRIPMPLKSSKYENTFMRLLCTGWDSLTIRHQKIPIVSNRICGYQIVDVTAITKKVRELYINVRH